MAVLAVSLMMVVLPILVAAQSQRSIVQIQPVIINGGGTSSCPSIIQRESVLQEISDNVRILLIQEYSRNEYCGEGVWYNLVSINMSDPLSQCPDGWVEENIEGVRACG